MTEPTVYVVDDDVAVAASVTALLQSEDLAVETFRSAEEFLESFQPDRTGCLVLDLRLAGMNGLELLRTLQADGIALPVVMISGHADAEITAQALQQGAAAFLQKPFSGDDLVNNVLKVLQRDSAD